jgi:L-ascorbate metabolism protein UlaG (beta-lactamase superfamily)
MATTNAHSHNGSDKRLRLGAGVKVLPMYGDVDLDSRLLFIGDNYRLLLRAYAEAIFRLGRDRSLAERDEYLRRSAEVNQFYEITTTADRIALRMRDEVFGTQARLEDLDLTLVAGRGPDDVTVPLQLDQLKAVGVLLPLLNGEFDRTGIEAGLASALDAKAAGWIRDVLERWLAAGLIEPIDARPYPFADGSARPRVTFMGHTSIMIQTATTTVISDPLYRPTLGIPDMAFDVTRIPITAICCTHSHWDHCDLASLLRFDKRIPIVIPRVQRPTAFNPPMIPALRVLGFTDIRELGVWETTTIGDIEMVAVPFHGEQDEPDAVIDHYTYVFRTKGLSIYGGVDAYRDTYGEMLPALERVRREWAPDVAFLPISRMQYAYRYGGVNGFCRYVDTTLLDEWFQYTAGAEQAIEWAKALGVKRVIPYATFNFTPFDVPAQSREFDEALRNARLNDLLLPLRPFDAATPDDLTDSSQASMRRQYLLTVLRAGAAAKRIDRRLKHNLGYRLVKRVLQGPPRQAAHHH